MRLHAVHWCCPFSPSTRKRDSHHSFTPTHTILSHLFLHTYSYILILTHLLVHAYTCLEQLVDGLVDDGSRGSTSKECVGQGVANVAAGLTGGLIAVMMRQRFAPSPSLVSRAPWQVPSLTLRQCRSPLFGISVDLEPDASTVSTTIASAALLGVGLFLFNVKPAGQPFHQPSLLSEPHERCDMTIWFRVKEGGDVLSAVQRGVACLGCSYVDVLVVDVNSAEPLLWQGAWRRAEQAVELGFAKFLACRGVPSEKSLRAVFDWAVIKPVALLVEDGGGKGGSGGVVSGRADTTFDAMVETAQKELRLHVAVISSAALTEEQASGSARRRRAAEAVGVCATETSQPFPSALASFRMSCGESVSWRTSCAPAHPRWPTCTRCHDFSGWGGDTSS